MAPSTIHCITDAPGCEAALACLGQARIPGASCTSETCAGTTAVTCFPGVRYEVDCAARGDICVDGPDGSYCSEPCTETMCDSGVLDRCQQSDLRCEQLGWTCDPSGPRCSDGTATACITNTTPPRCDSTALIECADDFEVRLECDRLIQGATCRTVGNSVFCGLGEECGGNSVFCGGTSLILCAFGVMRSIDCTALGFSGCVDTTCVP
jgi:hypothetical protein